MPISQEAARCWVYDLPPGTDDEGLTTHFATEAAARRSTEREWLPGDAPGIRQLAEPCWTATCDGLCEAEFEDDEGGSHGSSRSEAEQLVSAYGWIVTEAGAVFCDYDAPDCAAADLAVTDA